MSVTIRSRARKGQATEVSVLQGGSVVHQGLRDTTEAHQWVCRTYGAGIGVYYDMGYAS